MHIRENFMKEFLPSALEGFSAGKEGMGDQNFILPTNSSHGPFPKIYREMGKPSLKARVWGTLRNRYWNCSCRFFTPRRRTRMFSCM
jgi:hypothetical protein